MAFDGNFVYVYQSGTTNLTAIPNKYIALSSYVSTPNQRQDLDSYQDNNGYLHRNVLKHTRSKFEFNTPPMTEADLLNLQAILQAGITNEKERKIQIKYYCLDKAEYNSTSRKYEHIYKTGWFYIPDITFTPLMINDAGEIIMDKVRLAFIEY